MHSHAVKQRLQEIVARHQVYWEVWPEWAILRNHRREQIGFRLEFYARHLSNSTPLRAVNTAGICTPDCAKLPTGSCQRKSAILPTRCSPSTPLYIMALPETPLGK